MKQPEKLIKRTYRLYPFFDRKVKKYAKKNKISESQFIRDLINNHDVPF